MGEVDGRRARWAIRGAVVRPSQEMPNLEDPSLKISTFLRVRESVDLPCGSWWRPKARLNRASTHPFVSLIITLSLSLIGGGEAGGNTCMGSEKRTVTKNLGELTRPYGDPTSVTTGASVSMVQL